jgi:hypothetical protein
MANALESLSRWRRESPNQVSAIVVGLFIATASIWVGLKARAASQAISKRSETWEQTGGQLGALQQQFLVPTSRESAALIAESAHLSALGVPAAERVSLMEYLSSLADGAALSDVRVNFKAGMDSSFIPSRVVGADVLSPATYVVTVDFNGSFAGLVQFVSSLPPSVTMSRLGAARNGGRTSYHIVLSVYELPNGNSGG